MNAEEYALLQKNRSRTTEKSNSNYLRKLAFSQPITIRYRNDSLDALTKEVIALKKELNFIGHNFNQAVHKLHTLDRIPEFRYWVKAYEQTRITLTKQTETIVTRIHQICTQWSQE